MAETTSELKPCDEDEVNAALQVTLFHLEQEKAVQSFNRLSNVADAKHLIDALIRVESIARDIQAISETGYGRAPDGEIVRALAPVTPVEPEFSRSLVRWWVASTPSSEPTVVDALNRISPLEVLGRQGE